MVFKSLGQGSGFVANFRVSLTFTKDAILPPFTSRVMKSIVGKLECFKEIESLYSSTSAFKPVTFRVLRRGNKRLFKVRGSDSFITVRGGESLEGSFSVYISDQAKLPINSFTCGGHVDIDYAKVYVEPVETFIEEVSNLSVGLKGKGVFKMRILTPLVLTTKIMTPPPISGWSFIRRVEEAHRLLPTPSYIFSQAARQYLSMTLGQDSYKSWTPYAVGRLADISVAETGFGPNFKPVTVIYSKEGDKLKKVRGVVGVVRYRVLHEKITPALDKLLAFSQAMGLGRSRSMGFGEVVITASEDAP